jgi:hypothetical protein
MVIPRGASNLSVETLITPIFFGVTCAARARSLTMFRVIRSILERNQLVTVKRRIASTSLCGSSVPNANFRPLTSVMATASKPETL